MQRHRQRMPKNYPFDTSTNSGATAGCHATGDLRMLSLAPSQAPSARLNAPRAPKTTALSQIPPVPDRV
ncbi:hypothetical protein GQ53DRAFT_751380 [Thozetella sp. PMI_491]|nr:hypothetical protein GQ53DRAFT_751380 [Thozetella sp. PMI_491]